MQLQHAQQIMILVAQQPTTFDLLRWWACVVAAKTCHNFNNRCCPMHVVLVLDAPNIGWGQHIVQPLMGVAQLTLCWPTRGALACTFQPSQTSHGAPNQCPNQCPCGCMGPATCTSGASYTPQKRHFAQHTSAFVASYVGLDSTCFSLLHDSRASYVQASYVGNVA